MFLRASAVLLIAALWSASLAACSTVQTEGGMTGSASSCVAPYLDDEPPGEAPGGDPPVVQPGDTFTLYGHWYRSTCHDTGQGGPDEPLNDVKLTLTLPDGGLVPLGTFDAEGPDLGFSVDVTLPLDTATGTARVSDDVRSSQPFEFQISPAS